VILFAVVLVGISTIFASVTIGNTARVIKDFGLFSLSFFGALLTIIIGVTLLNNELKQKTIYNILSKPVDRWQFIFGKHLGLSATVSFLVSLMGVGLIGYVALFEGEVDWLLLQGVIFTLLEVIVVASVAIFFSSLVVTTTLTGIFTLATYIAGRSITYMNYFLSEKSEFYNPAFAVAVKVFDVILPPLTYFNVNDQIVYGAAVSPLYFGKAVVFAIAYSTICLILATFIFEKRELV
jgi:ABC-type transport system involved in multi-copper enzyme maturation permease subunit